MTALEEIKKTFPNMFRPLKWHHFEGATEHGCGEWYAHATRGMWHIYDVREKFPNDKPFYAKELSDQFDTLELAQEACQKRHEGDILIGLEPAFLSTLESLQRENEALKNLIDGDNCADPDKIDALFRRAEAAEAEAEYLRGVATDIQKGYIEATRRAEEAVTAANALQVRTDAAEYRENKLREALQFYANPEIYKPHPHGLAFDQRDLSYHARTALASTGGEHHAE